METSKIQKKLYKSLERMGISPRASDLYILIFQTGQTSITKLARELSIARPNVYKLITELKQEKLIIDREGQKKSGINIASPSILLRRIREKEAEYTKVAEQVSESMPELLAIYTQKAAPSKIKIFEGREQYIKAFDLIFEETISPMKFFGSAEDFITFTKWQGYKKLVKKRIKKKIQLQSLLLPSETAENMKLKAIEELREVRILKGLNIFETSFQVFNNKILFWQPKTPLAILIEDEYITKMMQSIFDKLWEEAGAL
jgi:sugar-specific transcriptional regulator TrmB